VILAATDADPRVLAGEFAGACIVAYATAGTVAPDPRFAETITVAAEGVMDPAVFERELAPRFARFAQLMETIFEAQLARDPYSAFLQLPFTDPEVMRQIPERRMRDVISLQQLRRFEATDTAKRWRGGRNLTAHLRDFFLSVDGREVIRRKTPEQLRDCERLVATLLEAHALDEHFAAVLKRHRHLIRRLLASQRSAL
jgi:hypothetical protein